MKKDSLSTNSIVISKMKDEEFYKLRLHECACTDCKNAVWQRRNTLIVCYCHLNFGECFVTGDHPIFISECDGSVDEESEVKISKHSKEIKEESEVIDSISEDYEDELFDPSEELNIEDYK